MAIPTVDQTEGIWIARTNDEGNHSIQAVFLRTDTRTKPTSRTVAHSFTVEVCNQNRPIIFPLLNGNGIKISGITVSTCELLCFRAHAT